MANEQARRYVTIDANTAAAHVAHAVSEVIAIYPITLFDNAAKLVLFTLIPAALMGAVPAEFVRNFTWGTLAQITLGAIVFLFIAVAVFRLGLRRYESGSGIQVEV